MGTDSGGPIGLMICPLCWNTSTRLADEAWCCGNQWGMGAPMDGDHEAERMAHARFYGARGKHNFRFVTVDALLRDAAIEAVAAGMHYAECDRNYKRSFVDLPDFHRTPHLQDAREVIEAAIRAASGGEDGSA